VPYAKRNCIKCRVSFIPPNTKGKPEWYRRHCPSCRRAVAVASDDPSIRRELAPNDNEIFTDSPPIKQAVFDLETFSLNRGWGVLLMGSILIHDGTKNPQVKTFKLRDYEPWKRGERSNDSELARDIIETLRPCHILYAHNGNRFDIPWLRSIALKYDLDFPEKKLIDPCAVAWKKYAIGRNSLSALADFLNLPEEKIHVPTDIWRLALMDDDDYSWQFLQERCESDVRLLNAIAGKVTRDVGMIDKSGSAFR
jgi:hypothetical protein